MYMQKSPLGFYTERTFIINCIIACALPLLSPSFLIADCFCSIKATPHKARLTALHAICLHIFRHLVQKFLDRRQPACKISIQSDEKSDGASCAQALCGVALKFIIAHLCEHFFNSCNALNRFYTKCPIFAENVFDWCSTIIIS